MKTKTPTKKKKVLKNGKRKAKKNLKASDEMAEMDLSSDDEMPEVVSNAAMKDDLDSLNKKLSNLKQQLREAEKAKRRKRQELYIAQKKTKASSSKTEGPDANDNVAVPPAVQPTIFDDVTPSSSAEESSKRKQTRKVYPSFNVTVEPLTKKEDSRALAALDFKSRRLAKVPRESVNNAVISYNQKLRVRKIQ